jgi:hypothetical protein
MSKVKIFFMEEELSTEEPDNYACLLEDIKEKFEDEEIANVSNDELLIKDGNGNEIKNNEDYNKYIKQTASNKIIKVSLKNDEQNEFSFLDFKSILDEKYNESEELEKIKKERDEYNKNQKKTSKPLEEEEIKYDTIFDEFSYIANATNKNVLSFFWKFFKEKCIVNFLRKADVKNNKKYQNIFDKILILKEQMEKNNEEIFKSIHDVKGKIDEQKNEINSIKEYIDKQKNEIINYINQNLNPNISDIQKMGIKNNEMIKKNLENMDENNKLIQEQIKNYITEISNFKKLIRAFPLKVKIEPMNKDLQLNDITKGNAELRVKIINLSKIPLKVKLKCLKEKESLVEFKDIDFELKEKEQIIPISLIYTNIGEYEEESVIHMILFDDYEKIICDSYIPFNVINGH